jgi:DNA-binding NarL/FixJ family response regulator
VYWISYWEISTSVPAVIQIIRVMEFKNEELVEREIEIAGYLINGFSLKYISHATGLSKKLLAAHLRNMMKKLKADGMTELIKTLAKTK